MNDMKNIKASFKDLKFVSKEQVEYLNSLDDYFLHSIGSTIDKLENFIKYVPRTSIARFLTKYEIFKEILDVQGSIVECGVLFGGGLMTWAQLSSIVEPMNHQRRIIGFDSFKGIPSVSDKDIKAKVPTELCQKGSFSIDSYEDLQECIKLYNTTRYFKNIDKIELVRGDILETVPLYIKNNPHLVLSLLYLDVDIYEPTKISLEYFLPRMPKGSIIVFDELNGQSWPGETLAVLEQFGNFNNLRINRQLLGTSISYVKLGS